MSHQGLAMRAALKNAPKNRMKHYPADFTECGCRSYNFAGCVAALVLDMGLGKRKCETCGATWEGDIKRHKNMPLLEWRTGIKGARGARR